jgi:hypothetical protein
MAHDGYEPAEGQAGGGCPVCSEQNMILEVTLSLTNFDRLSRWINTNASNGIMQLRKTSNQNTDYLNATNLNNFAFLYNVAIPAGLGISPSPSLSEEKSTGIIIPNNSDHDADLHRYSLDRSRSPGMPHRNNQMGISFSPSDSSSLRHEPFSAMYNNALMPSPCHSSTDYYPPPGSTCSFPLSTPQPILENEQMFFNSDMDMQHQQAQVFCHKPLNPSNSEATQYLYSPNEGSTFTVLTSAGPSASFLSSGLFGMAQHTNPTQAFQSHPMRSPSVHMGHGYMFRLSCDSDNGDEEGAAFADRTLITQPEFAQSLMEDPSIETGPGRGLQLDTNVCPCVPRRTVSRDKSIVLES